VAVCNLCGTVEESPLDVPLGWSSGVGTRGGTGARPMLLCPTCARRHVRDIEAKLDEAWWS
jgi:hypothetical protein